MINIAKIFFRFKHLYISKVSVQQQARYYDAISFSFFIFIHHIIYK